jgi:SGNH hydrolase-like domain, acetyltransferase AlgX
MKERYPAFAAVIIFLLVISLPLLQIFFKIFPETSLVGVSTPAPRPQFSLPSWYSGDFQAAAEKYFELHLGLKGYLIRTDNEINYLLFREIHQKTGSKLIVGLHDYLYEKSYIDAYIGRDFQPVAQLEERVQALKALQDYLQKKNVALVFLIAPSKASFYPEYIPPELIFKTTDPTPPSNYQQILPLLRKYGINFIDGRALLLADKSSAPYPIFSKSGTHWTRYGSCLVTVQLLAEIGRQLDTKINLPDCGKVVVHPVPLAEDRDLADLTNLWAENQFYQPLAYPQLQNSLPNDKINILAVGDSFMWSVIRNIKDGKLVNSLDFYYYFNTHYQYDQAVGPVDRSSDEVRSSLAKKNVVLIEVSETGLTDIGYGFLDYISAGR